MLKISIEDEDQRILLDVEGRLTGPWVTELEECWQDQRRRAADKTVSVRLRAVSFIDDGGKELLTRMVADGVKLEGNGCLIRAIVAKIVGAFHPDAAT